MSKRHPREILQVELCKLLREVRNQKGLSMNQVAAKAGLSQQMISYVERQMRHPTLDTLLRICEALEVDLADLLLKCREKNNPCPL